MENGVDGMVMSLLPPAIEELGNSSGFAMRLQDRANQGHAALKAAEAQLLALAAHSPKLAGVYADGLPPGASLQLNVDRHKAAALGVSFASISDTLSAAMGSFYVNDFPNAGRMQQVIIQAQAQSRMQIEDLMKLYVRNQNGGMVVGTGVQAGGRSIRELERLRDDYLVAIQQVLRQFNIGAGSTLRALEERLYAEQAARAPQASATDAQPLLLLDTAVRPEWLDYNNHLSDFRYAQLFGDAVDVLLRKVGIDDAYRQRGHAPYTVEVHIKHLKEVKQGDSVTVRTQLLHLDEKKMILFHRMQRQSDQALVATCEQLFVHVDTAAQKSSPFAASAFKALDAIWASQATLPRPAEAGGHIRHQS
jgi:acyl-CoA thioesterase FadM